MINNNFLHVFGSPLIDRYFFHLSNWKKRKRGKKKEERIISLVLTTVVFGGKLSFILSFPF
jgi:hypothetical protein